MTFKNQKKEKQRHRKNGTIQRKKKTTGRASFIWQTYSYSLVFFINRGKKKKKERKKEKETEKKIGWETLVSADNRSQTYPNPDLKALTSTKVGGN